MINTVILQGRLTNDVEAQSTPNGTSVAHFRLAVQDNHNGETQFFNCTAWRGAADNISLYCGKGREIIVQGSLNINKYTDRDGNNREKYEVSVREFYFTADKGNKTTGDVEPAYDDEQEALPF